jgi:hypothetical protein
MAQYVRTKFRKHPLSFIPGGCTVIILHSNRESYIYDKIKHLAAYVEAALEKSPSIVRIYVDNVVIWDLTDQQPKPRKLIPLLRAAA